MFCKRHDNRFRLLPSVRRAAALIALSAIPVLDTIAGENNLKGFRFSQDGKTLLWAPANVTECTIPDGVTHIARGVFSRNRVLKSITLPESLTEIGPRAFSGCIELTDITLPPGVKTIGSGAFRGAGCEAKLKERYPQFFQTEKKSAKLPEKKPAVRRSADKKAPVVGTGTVEGDRELGFKFSEDGKTLLLMPVGVVRYSIPSGVTGCGREFVTDKKSLQSITFPSGFEEIPDHAFFACRSLVEVKLPAGLVRIGEDAFKSCWELGSVRLPDGLTEIGDQAFMSCWALQSVEIPDSVGKIGKAAFSDCRELETVKLSSSLTEISESMFSGCFKLASVTIPPGVKKIGAYAFSGRNKLKSLNLPEGLTEIGRYAQIPGELTIPKSTTVIGQGAISAAKSVTVAAGNPVFYTDAAGVVFDKQRNALVVSPLKNSGAYTIPQGITEIDESAFSENFRLVSVTIPDSVTKIGAWAFFRSGLTAVTIPSGVRKIGRGTFRECDKLAEVALPDGLTEIEPHAFAFCPALKSIKIPGSVTKIDDEAFFRAACEEQLKHDCAKLFQ